MSKFKAGVIGIAIIVVGSYLAFTKFKLPFVSSKFTVHAIVNNANGLRPDSLVRIAGVNVGKVQQVEPVTSCKVNGTTQHQCQAANVSMQIDDIGLPIHKDATFQIRPRIFLEGNFIVDIRPGTPTAATAPDGWTFPINATSEPVQVDQVLTSLQGDTRHNLQVLLQQYGKGVKQAGPSYNASIKYWLPAYKNSSIVAHDFLGIRPHDLSTWIAQQGPVAGALDAHPQNLKSLVTDFNTTAAAFARQNVALQQAVAELPRTLAAAIPAFNSLNASFPPLRAFAKALTPGVVSTGPMIDASLPFITQLRLLVQPSELRGLTADLAITVPALAKLTVATIPLMKHGVRPLSSCVANEIYPWSQLTLNDPSFNGSNGFPPHKVYVEAVDFLPGLAGESRVFDANGPYVRILGTGGTFAYSLGAPPGFVNKVVGTSISKISGEAPQLPPLHYANGSKVQVYRPPLQPNTACETQPAITDLSTPQGPPLSQTSSPDNASSPTAKKNTLRAWKQALAQLERIAKQEGIKVVVGGKPVDQNGNVGAPPSNSNPNSGGNTATQSNTLTTTPRSTSSSSSSPSSSSSSSSASATTATRSKP